MASSEAKDPLSLRVMRLSQPRLASSIWNRTDALINSTLSADPNDPKSELLVAEESPKIGEDFALQLPTQQGRVFAGETFRAYIDVVNLSTGEIVQDVSLTVQINKGLSKTTLFDNSSNPVARLAPHQSLDTTIEYPIQSIGPHILVCQILYTPIYFDTQPSQKSIKKTYRFPALSPFKINHRAQFVPNKAFIECSIENQTGSTLYLEDASVICSPNVRGVRLHNSNEKKLHRGLEVLRSRDVHNVLFLLEPNEAQTDVYFLKRLPSFGRLALSWRLHTGGHGKLDVYSIDNNVEAPKIVELRMKSCPTTVQVEVPFIVELECINRSGGWINSLLHFTRDSMAPLYLQGETQVTLTPLPPNTSQIYNATLVALVPGLHPLRGVVLRNSQDGEVFHNPDPLGNILVF